MRVTKRLPLANSKKPERFRPNVVICVINPKGEILLTQNVVRPGHWQFPQGGVDNGEEYEQAVRRELYEEVGIKDINIIAITKNIYSYRLPKRFLLVREDVAKSGYVGQIQSLAIAKVDSLRPKLKPDPQEAAATTWVDSKRLINTLHPVRRSLGKLAMIELQRLGLTS